MASREDHLTDEELKELMSKVDTDGCDSRELLLQILHPFRIIRILLRLVLSNCCIIG